MVIMRKMKRKKAKHIPQEMCIALAQTLIEGPIIRTPRFRMLEAAKNASDDRYQTGHTNATKDVLESMISDK